MENKDRILNEKMERAMKRLGIVRSTSYTMGQLDATEKESGVSRYEVMTYLANH